MIFGLILGQNQAIGVVTTRRLVMTCVLIHTRLPDRIGLLLAIQHVAPNERICPIQFARLDLQLTRMLHHRDTISRVTCVGIVVLAGVDIGLTMEAHRLLVAEREQRIHIHELFDRQIQTVHHAVAVWTNARILVHTRLTFRHSMPREGRARTDRHHRVDRVYCIRR